MKYKEDDVILCKVKKIEGTSVFVETEEGIPGSMTLSEVAAGRIRNLREYVSPNRLIVCKVLRIAGEHLELSLRRVTSGEKSETLERHKREKAFANMLKTIGEKENVIEEIKKEHDISEFLEEAREDVKVLEKYFDKEKAKKLFGILAEKIGKDKVVEEKFVLRSEEEDGIKVIKEILDVDAEIHYLGSGRFSINASGKDFKEADIKLNETLEEIRKRAEKKKAFFEIGK